ncbi:Hsp70 family protein [Streptomyces sp. MAR4 CNX-425]|uniref:Hsp70 family protein n=1 Tax=Streptomyces sp. MAR4 CNX-425 TaxID=3406343 RepID=UPI003B514790
MSETIDYGIDLGTTNSAIAVAEDGGVRVLKNNDGADTTPSAVWIPKKDAVYVGRRARERTESDPANAHAEFKLEMGVAGATRRFERAGLSLTPEQLSAEVLRSLRQDAAQESGFQPEAAVITVPAAFALNQNNATSDAAALAGLSEHCPLVQEPTAAAIAYGVQDTSDSAHWMVFDLGGGTFDAAVMSKRDGELQLIQHAGDPYLGGKLIDWAIVDDLLAPAIRRDLGLPDFTRSNRRWVGNFAKLKIEAENAKIELSRAEKVDLIVDLADGDGGSTPFEYTLTRGALDDLALPFYTRAVTLCREALAESGLRPDHIDGLLLAGGSTLSPGLRELLAGPDTGLGIAVDHSQDPTTVVARGAAAFARTVRRPRKAVTAAPGEFAAELNYPVQTVDTTEIPVSGKLSGGSTTVDWTRYAVVLGNPDGKPPFRGPRTALTPEGTFYTEVALTAGTTSRFTVELTDDTGTRQRLAGDTLSITHAKVVPGEAVLTGTLGIGRADGTFDPLLRKGTTLPAMVTKVYRTTIALHRSEPDAVIRIPLLEGERGRAERNTRVGLLEIRPRDVRIDLPAESEVEVTFEIEASSREAVVTAHIPLVQQQFEATVNRTELLAPEHPELVDRLHGLEQRVHTLTERADDAYAEQARAKLENLAEHRPLAQLRREVDAAAVDTGAAVTSDRRIRDLEAQLDDVEDAIEIPGLERQLWDQLSGCEDIIQQVGGSPSDRRELESLRARASALGKDATPADLRRLSKRAGEFQVELLRRTDQWAYLVFNALVEMRDQMYPRHLADAAVRDGRQAVAMGDIEALGGVNERLRRLLPPDVADVAERIPGGLK